MTDESDENDTTGGVDIEGGIAPEEEADSSDLERIDRGLSGSGLTDGGEGVVGRLCGFDGM